jgi:hypothetical protein
MGLRTFKLLPLEDIQQVEARALGSGMLEHDERTARWPFIIFGKVFGSYSLGVASLRPLFRTRHLAESGDECPVSLYI